MREGMLFRLEIHSPWSTALVILEIETNQSLLMFCFVICPFFHHPLLRLS